MVLVLADDFSGAAEIGGIGYRYGLTTEIQLNLDLSSQADLIVLDTNSRALSETDAASKLSDIGIQIQESKKQFRLFKKIDSVMRGHLVPEINALHHHLKFNNALLLPANPTRGRKIVDGKYLIDGTPLHETVFARDPDFPTMSSDIFLRVRSFPSPLKHVHSPAQPSTISSSIITADIREGADFEKYIAVTTSNDLCCGAAELFESFLRNLGYNSTSHFRTEVSSDFSHSIILNGSTVKTETEKKMFDESNIEHFTFPGTLSENRLLLEDYELERWHRQIIKALKMHHTIAVSIEHPIQHNKGLSETFLKYFADLMKYITDYIPLFKIHWCITGGATASSVIRQINEGKLYVKEEIRPGIVTLELTNNGKTQGLFTVKPGSYPWPLTLIKTLVNTSH